LIQYVIDQAAQLGFPTILIANDLARYQPLGLPVFADTLAEKGSLGGIYSALQNSHTDLVVCVACDMPFLNPALLRYLTTLAQDVDAVVPHVNQRPQGLHAVFRQSCIPTMGEALKQGRLKVGDFLKQAKVHWVEEADLRRFDATLRSFTNINTPDQLQRAEGQELIEPFRPPISDGG
jgi:molybdopterin-guanine dinucleotide biosynthesis protein A